MAAENMKDKIELFEKTPIVLQRAFQAAVGIVRALFDHAGVFLDIRKVLSHVVLAHNQTAVADFLSVFRREILCPIKRNVAALYD